VLLSSYWQQQRQNEATALPGAGCEYKVGPQHCLEVLVGELTAAAPLEMDPDHQLIFYPAIGLRSFFNVLIHHPYFLEDAAEA
jgi:hypothetical protein